MPTKKTPAAPELHPPSDWHYDVRAATRPESPHVDLVALDGGRGLEAPSRFIVTIRRLRRRPPLTLTLTYDVLEGIPTITAATAEGVDLVAGLDELRSARPLAWWTSRAVSDLSTFSIAEQLVASGRLAGHLPADGEKLSPEQMQALVRKVLSPEVIAEFVMPQLEAGLDYEPPTRRNRVTDAHLQEVARIYNEADDRGEAPRLAVAKQLNASPSTASKWIDRARSAGYIGPAGKGARTDRTPAAARKGRKK